MIEGEVLVETFVVDVVAIPVVDVDVEVLLVIVDVDVDVAVVIVDGNVVDVKVEAKVEFETV